MQKYYILALFAIFFNISESSASLGRDSIGVENLKGKKLIVHQVVQHDTYYSIGRRYNVSPKDIMNFNENKYLQIGVVIKVPTNIPFKEESTPVQATKNNKSGTASPAGNYTEHTVQPKDNLNRLAQKYGTTVEEIKRINELSTVNLKIGQILKMPAQEGGEQKAIETKEERPSRREEPSKNTESTVAGNGGTYIEHVVQPKENLNMLAEKYGTTINEIKRINNLNSSNLKIAQVLKVPAKAGLEEKAVENTPVKAAEINKTVTTPVAVPANQPSEEFVEHTVASNETIYSIATKYGMTMDQLKTKNKLDDNALSVGQKLLIRGQYPVKKPVAPPANNAEADTLSSIKNPSLKYAPSRYGLNQIDEKGTAMWISDQDLDPSKMLVLHRTAPIGTVIKITNPMSNRSTFAKVVGKFTENESTKDVIIVMTKAVADALGALDKRFFCNLTYSGQDNNEQ